jgi:hypothetical protein
MKEKIVEFAILVTYYAVWLVILLGFILLFICEESIELRATCETLKFIKENSILENE